MAIPDIRSSGNVAKSLTQIALQPLGGMCVKRYPYAVPGVLDLRHAALISHFE